MSNVRNIHFEAVGSYLRPAELKEARAKFADGQISAIDLRAVEDRLITEVISQQKAHRLPYITDGEFRRSYWHLDFMWGFNGVEHIELEWLPVSWRGDNQGFYPTDRQDYRRESSFYQGFPLCKAV